MKNIEFWIEKAKENAFKISKNNVEIGVHVLIDQEEDLFTAHCLEFDIVADGRTVDEAEKNIIDAIVNHVSFCIANDTTDKILHPAPREYWNKFYFRSKKAGESFKFSEDYTHENVKLPFLKNLIKEVQFNQALTCA